MARGSHAVPNISDSRRWHPRRASCRRSSPRIRPTWTTVSSSRASSLSGGRPPCTSARSPTPPSSTRRCAPAACWRTTIPISPIRIRNRLRHLPSALRHQLRARVEPRAAAAHARPQRRDQHRLGQSRAHGCPRRHHSGGVPSALLAGWLGLHQPRRSRGTAGPQRPQRKPGGPHAGAAGEAREGLRVHALPRRLRGALGWSGRPHLRRRPSRRRRARPQRPAALPLLHHSRRPGGRWLRSGSGRSRSRIRSRERPSRSGRDAGGRPEELRSVEHARDPRPLRSRSGIRNTRLRPRTHRRGGMEERPACGAAAGVAAALRLHA